MVRDGVGRHHHHGRHRACRNTCPPSWAWAAPPHACLPSRTPCHPQPAYCCKACAGHAAAPWGALLAVPPRVWVCVPYPIPAPGFSSASRARGPRARAPGAAGRSPAPAPKAAGPGGSLPATAIRRPPSIRVHAPNEPRAGKSCGRDEPTRARSEPAPPARFSVQGRTAAPPGRGGRGRAGCADPPDTLPSSRHRHARLELGHQLVNRE